MTNTERIQAHNAELREAIELAENLPDVGEGGTPTPTQEKTVDIKTNGIHEVLPDEGYALSKVTANVNVPIPDGYIQPSGTLDVTKNGTYDVTENASVAVNVPSDPPNIQSLNITENGTYTAPSGVDGYSPIVVNVESVGGGDDIASAIIDKTIVEFINDKAASIGEYSFRSCTKLKTVNAPNATSIGQYAFTSCSALASVNLPLVESVGQYAFNQCNKLMSVVLPSVTSIVANAFRDMQYAETIDLPLLTNVPANAFYGCRGLKALILRSPAVVTLANTSAFTTCYRILGTKNSGFNPNGEKIGFIYVPKALIEQYQVATNWSDDSLVTQFRAIEDYPEITGG